MTKIIRYLLFVAGIIGAAFGSWAMYSLVSRNHLPGTHFEVISLVRGIGTSGFCAFSLMLIDKQVKEFWGRFALWFVLIDTALMLILSIWL